MRGVTSGRALVRIELAAISDTDGRTWRRGSSLRRQGDDPMSDREIGYELLIRRLWVRVPPPELQSCR